MSAPIRIPRNERGTIRVFAVNRPAADMAAALRRRPVADVAREVIGDPHLDTASAELFPVADLAGVGLTAYLAEGYAVEAAQLQADRAKLDRLDGYVLLIFSDSFGGAEATLAPGPDATLIGTYAEAQADMSAPPISADSAKPYSGTPGTTPPTPARGPAGSAMAILALLVALGLLAWWLLK